MDGHFPVLPNETGLDEFRERPEDRAAVRQLVTQGERIVCVQRINACISQRVARHCQLKQGWYPMPSVARRFGAESPWHAYRAAPSQERGEKKVDSTEL